MDAIAEIKAIHHSSTEVNIPQKYKEMLDKVTTTNTMPLAEFVRRTDFDINQEMVGKFFMNLRDDTPVYISDDATIKFMGYSGNVKDGRRKLMEMIERNFTKGTHYWRFSNAEYCEWLKSLSVHMVTQSTIQQSDEKTDVTQHYPPVPTGRGTGRVTHLIVTTDTFREIMMMLETSKAKEIRRYYIQLEKLIKVYSYYQRSCFAVLSRTSFGKLMDKFDEMNKRLDETNKNLVVTNGELCYSRRLIRQNTQETRELKSVVQQSNAKMNDVASLAKSSASRHVVKRSVPAKHEQVLVIYANDDETVFHVYRGQFGRLPATYQVNLETLNRWYAVGNPEYDGEFDINEVRPVPNATIQWLSFLTENRHRIIKLGNSGSFRLDEDVWDSIDFQEELSDHDSTKYADMNEDIDNIILGQADIDQQPDEFKLSVDTTQLIKLARIIGQRKTKGGQTVLGIDFSESKGPFTMLIEDKEQNIDVAKHDDRVDALWAICQRYAIDLRHVFDTRSVEFLQENDDLIDLWYRMNMIDGVKHRFTKKLAPDPFPPSKQ